MTGLERIAGAFERARADGRDAALMPYLMGGYPDLDTSYQIGLAYVRGGADLIELGVPFSDPLADGPVIHAAATAALRGGVRLREILSLAGELADHVPVIVMSYANPILAYGVESFADALVQAGCGGLIVPDLPTEEAGPILQTLDSRGVALVPLVAPTTTDERLAGIGSSARGFVYVVSVTGTTGERASSEDALAGLIARARSRTTVPVAVGFGIGTPAQARAAAAAGADGVIIGSRLVRCVREEREPVKAVERQVHAFATALAAQPTG